MKIHNKIASSLFLALLLPLPLTAAVGDLDPTFGAAGKVVTSIGPGNDEALAVAVYPDGKILVVGSYNNVSTHMAMARYNPNGSLDTSFGVGGTSMVPLGFTYDDARGVILQPNGKIIVVGTEFTSAATSYDCFLARFEANGNALDASFGTGGKVVKDFGHNDFDFCGAIALQPDGKILFGGYTTNPGAPSYEDFALARYNANGTPDSTFDTDGALTTNNNSQDDIRDLAVLGNGNIVAGGISNYAAANIDFVVLVYGPTGALLKNEHLNFNNYFDWLTDLAIDPAGRILVAGYSFDGSSDDHFSVARYLPDVTLDAGFGTGGKAIFQIGNNDGQPGVSLALQQSGKILLAGSSIIAPSISRDFAIARLNDNGLPDAGFGSAGKVIVNIGTDPNEDIVRDMGLQPDGKILVAGYTVPSFEDFALIRLDAEAPVSAPPPPPPPPAPPPTPTPTPSPTPLPSGGPGGPGTGTIVPPGGGTDSTTTPIAEPAPATEDSPPPPSPAPANSGEGGGRGCACRLDHLNQGPADRFPLELFLMSLATLGPLIFLKLRMRKRSRSTNQKETV